MPPRRALLNGLLCLPEDGPLRRKTSGGDKPTPNLCPRLLLLHPPSKLFFDRVIGRIICAE